MKDKFEDYRSAILAQYEVVKNEKNSHYLLDPTPSNLKSLASELTDGISNKDESAFKTFFGYKEDVSNKAKAILNFETDKFRPLSKFLNRKSNLQDIAGANLLAVLVDLENRPFVKFREEIYPNPSVVASNKETGIFKGKQKTQDLPIKKHNFKKALIFICIASFIGFSGVSLSKAFEKKCMVWKDNHYEKIDCDEQLQGFANYATIFPVDEEKVENFRKIEVSKDTKFFENGKPIVWYLKHNNKCEFFNSFGLHPVSQKTLKEVTPYIVNKYVFED